MKQVLTPGRWRGLRAASSSRNIFNILAFDQRGTLLKMMPPGSTYEAAVHVKTEIVVKLSDYVSAVLLDPEYGLGAAQQMNGHTGLLMAIEKSGYDGGPTNRRVTFLDGWNAGTIKQVGASGVKLLAYYHPESGALAEEIEAIIQRVIEDCHAHDLPLFVEPLSYSLDANVPSDSAEFAKARPGLVVETARRLSKFGIDILKMEFPVNVAYDTDQKSWQKWCEALSAASSVPWVLLSAGVDFDTFAEQTRVACRAGASGYLAGRAIWKEAVVMGEQDRQRFMAEIGIPRLNRLNEIADHDARPWTDFYEPSPVATSYLHLTS